MIPAVASCEAFANAGSESGSTPLVADLLLSTDDLDQLRLGNWTEVAQLSDLQAVQRRLADLQTARKAGG